MGSRGNSSSNRDEINTLLQIEKENVAEERDDGGEQFDGTSIAVTENDDFGKSDESLTRDACYERAMSSQQSPVTGIVETKESSSGSPKRTKGLDHSITAPLGVRRNLFLENDSGPLTRSMTDLKLDRLSEIEEKNLIANLIKIRRDGTVEVDWSKNESTASDLLELQSLGGSMCRSDSADTRLNMSTPKLKITMLVVGTRGDVQPFIAIAKRLQEFGHHVRLATHVNFSSFVKSAGVEFYPLGGDPRVLIAYMVRNKGWILSSPGEISIQRKQLKSIIESLLPACTGPDLESGEPFHAQAIIANPPAYGHVHIAEALGVPIHIFFTMPWTPTSAFPHPFARVPQSTYWLSYVAIDLVVWWGIRGYINDFRKKKLNLPPISYFSLYNGSIAHLPTGYMWSPHLVPKPSDWGPQVDVVGFCLLNHGSKYQPPNGLVQWLQNGPKPIYIGFGSMPLDDPKKTMDVIMEALRITGQRGIIGQGWGDLGTFAGSSDDVYLLEDCPHDWLFPQCLAVVHHGGAGTIATGLRAGCPTTVVPFFGDQFFWGERIHEKGLGPSQIPISELTVEALSDAITFMLQPEVKTRALEIAKELESEDGVAGAVDAFHRHLPSELPLPRSLSQKEYEHPSPLQWFFTQIGNICSRPCGRS